MIRANLINKLPEETRRIFETIPSIIKKTFPVPSRFQRYLPSDIAKLSGLLTNARGERSLAYLNNKNLLSAYLYYFLPWNLYRLCILLPALDINLKAKDLILDLGSGPLTFASALWISRPELRGAPLEFTCIDRSLPALKSGDDFFRAVSGNSAWKINLIKDDINFKSKAIDPRFKNKAAFVCAINTLNEIYENIPHTGNDEMRETAGKTAIKLHLFTAGNGSILAAEPGIPQSGKFISLLRSSLLELGHQPASPCSHASACPLSINKTSSSENFSVSDNNSRSRNNHSRWCHFAFDTKDAPKELHRLSAAAKIPKERLVFSYLYAVSEKPSLLKNPPLTRYTPEIVETDVRIISDVIALPDKKYGRYGCSIKGLVLLTGEKEQIENTMSGNLVKSVISANDYDKKSGALFCKAVNDE